jgi:uncharacterized protein (DUF58 family)
MSALAKFLTGRDIQKISNLQVLARSVVEGFCAGLHRSPHKGFSVEFRQHRQYVHGDEIRRIDWKVFGRSDRFYIREYEEETNVRTTLLLDCSGSMNYASGETTKHAYATRLAACLSYLMLQQADGVGLVTFDTKIRNYIPPRTRPSHLRNLLETMEAAKPGGETELGDVFHDVAAKIHRRGLLIILSDCFGDIPQLMKALAQLRYAHHEIIVFQIWDRAELEFDFKRWTRFECLERDGRHQLVDPAQLREAYLANLEKFRAELKKACHRNRIDLVPVVTDQPYAEALASYLALRSARA